MLLLSLLCKERHDRLRLVVVQVFNLKEDEQFQGMVARVENR